MIPLAVALTALVLVFTILRTIEAIREPRAARKQAREDREMAVWSARYSATRLGKRGLGQ